MNGRQIIGEIWLLSGKKEYIHDNALFLLNSAITQVVLDIDVFNDEYSKDCEIGVQYYELPSDTLEVLKVCYDDKPLDRKYYEAIKEYYSSNSTPKAFAVTYYNGLFQIYIAPPPDEVKPLDFMRKKQPAYVTTLDENIEMPAWTVRALTLYCKKLVFESSRLPQFANAHQEYLLEIQKRNSEFGEVNRFVGSIPKEIEYVEIEP